MVVVQFDFPISVVFLLDLVDVVVGEVSSHIFSDLHGNKLTRNTAVNRSTFAVNGLPNEVEIEVDVGSIGQFHIDFVAVKLDSLDAHLREISANESVDFREVEVASAAVAASVAASVDYIEVVVKPDFRSVLHLDFPAKALFLDFLYDLAWEVGGHISGDLLRHNACGYAGVDGRMFAVHFHPFKRVREFQLGTVVEFYLVVVLRLIAVEDTSLREMRHDEFHNRWVNVALVYDFSDFKHVLVACNPGCCFGRCGF